MVGFLCSCCQAFIDVATPWVGDVWTPLDPTSRGQLLPVCTRRSLNSGECDEHLRSNSGFAPTRASKQGGDPVCQGWAHCAHQHRLHTPPHTLMWAPFPCRLIPPSLSGSLALLCTLKSRPCSQPHTRLPLGIPLVSGPPDRHLSIPTSLPSETPTPSPGAWSCSRAGAEAPQVPSSPSAWPWQCSGGGTDLCPDAPTWLCDPMACWRPAHSTRSSPAPLPAPAHLVSMFRSSHQCCSLS